MRPPVEAFSRLTQWPTCLSLCPKWGQCQGQMRSGDVQVLRVQWGQVMWKCWECSNFKHQNKYEIFVACGIDVIRNQSSRVNLIKLEGIMDRPYQSKLVLDKWIWLKNEFCFNIFFSALTVKYWIQLNKL